MRPAPVRFRLTSYCARPAPISNWSRSTTRKRKRSLEPTIGASTRKAKCRSWNSTTASGSPRGRWSCSGLPTRNPAAGLIPPAGKPERYRVQEWLNFITSELHKSFGPIFRPTAPDAYKTISKENLGKRFDWLDKQLAGKQYLMGDKFSVADAYLFTVLRWTARINMDLAKWPNLKGYVDRVAARPKVQEALKAEGLSK